MTIDGNAGPSKPPLVVVEAGYETWRILGPTILYGGEWDDGRYEDRRYEELCVVNGPIRKAFERLKELEKARA